MEEKKKHISLAEYAEAVGISKQAAHKRLTKSKKHPGIKKFETIGHSMVLHLSKDYENYFQLI